MHIACPHCNHEKDIGRQGGYYVYQCDKCGKRFRGIHGKANYLKYAFECLSPFNDSYWHDRFRDVCPYCGLMVDYTRVSYGNYMAPEVCIWCHSRLPTWEPLQDSISILDDEREILIMQRQKEAQEQSKKQEVKKERKRIRLEALKQAPPNVQAICLDDYPLGYVITNVNSLTIEDVRGAHAIRRFKPTEILRLKLLGFDVEA